MQIALVITSVVAVIAAIAAAVLFTKIGSLRSEIETLKTAYETEQERALRSAEKEAAQIKKQAVLDAKEKLQADRDALEKDAKELRQEAQQTERRLAKKEENLDRKLAEAETAEKKLEQRRKDVERLEQRIEQNLTEIQGIREEQETMLQNISGMTREQAKQQLVDILHEEARSDGAAQARRIVEETKENAEEKAKYILANTIQRVASEYVAESTVSVVDLPSDDMKGRIIGREGRNIRAIEAATGVDLIIDDTPECVLISGFDPVKRHNAGVVLKKLLADGRIHPARVEETVHKVERDTNKTMRENGKNAAFEVGIHGLHEDILNMMGRLTFRKSYSQNVLRHSVEVAFICGIIAAELGANIKIAKRAGFLHDIGKAMDHEQEGPHAILGAEFCKKYGESEEVLHAIGAHHYDWEPSTLEALIVITADALSAARPGARREAMQNYIKRLEDLENLSRSFDGVEKAYAIQAGREIRVIVEPGAVNDDGMSLLARDIAKKIEEEAEYPGEVKVTVIRETRTVEFAR